MGRARERYQPRPLAYSWETPERNYEGAKLIAQAIKNAR
jgi:hypothetical protein